MAESYLSEIRVFSFNYAPKGWAMCNGQLMPINQNQALFALLGTTYGGDGRVTFGLPDLQGRVALHVGNGFALGQRAGESSHTLTQTEMPQHSHPVRFATDTTETSPAMAPHGPGKYWAPDTAGNITFATTDGVMMSSAAIAQVGGSQSHTNMEPYLVLNFCIALTGIFPSRT